MAKKISELLSRNSKPVSLLRNDPEVGVRDSGLGTGSWINTVNSGSTDSYKNHNNSTTPILTNDTSTGVRDLGLGKGTWINTVNEGDKESFIAYNNQVSKLPGVDYTGIQEVSKHVGSDDIVELPASDTTPTYKDYLVPVPENTNPGYQSIEDYQRKIKIINDSIKLVGDTLSKYKQFKKDPVSTMSLFGGLLTPNIGKAGKALDITNQVTDALGLGELLPDIANGVIPLPGYLQYEDERAVLSCMNLIQTTVQSLYARQRPNYELLFLSQSNGDLIDGLLNAVTGDYFKKEFEKGRLPWGLPVDELTKHEFSTYYGEFHASKPPKSLWGTVKGILLDTVKETFGDWTDQSIDGKRDAINIIQGNKPISDGVNLARRKYGYLNGPYDYKEHGLPASSFAENIESDKQFSLNGIKAGLEAKNYLKGYKNLAGFEMGSNHDWLIKLKPYRSICSNGSERFTCTPPLPMYVLPDLWNTTNQIESTLPQKGGWIDNLVNKSVNKVISGLSTRLTSKYKVNDGNLNQETITDALLGALKDAIFGSNSSDTVNTDAINVRYFDYSEDTPVISYDLNFGTIRTDSLRLFNGNSVEVFAGMNYHATMNMSILDDYYHSMYKYMIEYTNNIYSIDTHSIAPYHSMAFEIELIIFRSGKQIDQHHRFVAIPIEFTPRLDGSSEPNECRVDLTFGIIGYIQPTYLDKPVYIEGTLDRWKSTKNTENSEVKTELTWRDIQINMGSGINPNEPAIEGMLPEVTVGL